MFLIYQNIENTFRLVLLISFLLISPMFIVSLLSSVFQAATQIQDQIFSYFAKLLVFSLMALVLSPWIIEQLSLIFLNSFDSLLILKKYFDRY